LKVWLFAVLLVLWGNLLHPLLGGTAVLPGGSWQFVVAGAALVVVSIVAARAIGLDAAALGFRRAGAFRGALIGALAAGAIAAVDVLVLRLAPAIIGQPVGYSPLERVSAEELGRHIALYLPFGAVIPEEVAFRGTLLAGLLQRYGIRTAVTASAIVFALWHGTVAVFTVINTTMPVVLVVPAIAGALVVVFVGGVIMAGLRLATGSLAASIAAHWIFNAVILIGLWADQAVAAPAT
jgi:membrane protease YdiL (CAAX protease family)